jgi:hypothetical protein
VSSATAAARHIIVHRGARAAWDIDPASKSTLLGRELLLTQNWFAAGHECSKSWLLGFIAPRKLALIHDQAELLPRADQSHFATQAGPKGKVQVEAKELLAAYACNFKCKRSLAKRESAIMPSGSIRNCSFKGTAIRTSHREGREDRR